MLIALSIRDFILIDALDADVHRGFTSVTGETGAGKSILLDALRFVLGSKADKRFIRAGAEKTVVSASFHLPHDHMALIELRERDLLGAEDDVLTFRRILSATGPSRMYVNEQIISADFIKSLGESLVEIHGQHDGSALLNPRLHREVLDQFAQSDTLLARVGVAFSAVSDSREACKALKARASSRETELIQLEQMLEDLDRLAPGEGEASRLAMERAVLINSQKLIECLSEADEAVRRSDAAQAFSSAARLLDRACRLPELAEAEDDNPHLTALKSAQEAIERALIEIDEAGIAVETARAAFDHDPDALEEVEQRLFSLRAAGRKFNIDPDALCDMQADARVRLGQLVEFDDSVSAAEADVKAKEAAYLDVAVKLSALRKSSGEKLAKSVLSELKPLKLEHAKFRVRVDQMDISRAGPNGMDNILFEVQTNPGSPFGALNQIASGGELARFTLALRVCLAAIQSASLLIFDEADQGVGGAVAAAVGERLGRLAEERQVMAITHSPQVAASGHHHWHISKKVSKGSVTSSKMTVLERDARLEEVARMLSGSEITNEARAAAERLMAERV